MTIAEPPRSVALPKASRAFPVREPIPRIVLNEVPVPVSLVDTVWEVEAALL
jgi:hypothetical protein